MIELVAVLHVRPMTAARKDMHARIGKTAQHEQPDVERAGAIILPPHDQRLGLYFKQIEIEILSNERFVADQTFQELTHFRDRWTPILIIVGDVSNPFQRHWLEYASRLDY